MSQPVNGKFVLVVSALAIHDNRLCIIQRSKKLTWLPGVWSLPGGKVDLGENVEEAVSRELAEETGLVSSTVRLLSVSDFKGFKNDVYIHNIQLNYLVSVANSFVILGQECDDHLWIAIEDYNSSPLDVFNKKIISDSYALIRAYATSLLA